MDQSAGVRIRRMARADVGAVMEIAESLPEAPDWPPAAYLAALDPEGMPRRVALVAVQTEGKDLYSQVHPSGAKEDSENGQISSGLPEKPASGAKAPVDSVGFLQGLKPPPPSETRFSAALEAVTCQSELGNGAPGSAACESPETVRDPGLGAVIGFAVACMVAPQAELEMIAVAGVAQRHGVAGRLFAALVEELHGTGVTEVALEVRGSNRPALGLYRWLGFQETGLRRRYYADPVEDAVLMSLQIGGLTGGPH